MGSKEKVLDKFHPSIVVSGFVGKSVYDYYQITKDDRCIEVLLGIKKYIEKYLHVTENEKGICFSYTDVIKDCCFNASLLAAEILAIVAKITDDREAFAKAKAAVDFVVGYQKEDGRWNYSVDIKTGKEDTQLDFHQGFVIDSIQNFVNHSAETDTRYLLSIQKGLEFYYNFYF
ncbi:MAG: hypothetical protein IPJ75_16180 [Ignavibacteriales bacterium]|nr:hypothetical protein [Ignavibacteriales bacterium]